MTREEQKHQWYLNNKERIQLRNQTPKIKESRRKNHDKWNKNNRRKTQKYCRDYRNKLTTLVINHYGGKCACCGEIIFEFLTIDHIKGNGREERRKLGSNNLSIYRLIVKNNYPNEYRVLCYNCNCGRERNNGVCPHATT